jgi:hypothetical protein
MAIKKRNSDVRSDTSKSQSKERRKVEQNQDDSYYVICDVCQIVRITDSCKHCGLYHYGDKFDIIVRPKIMKGEE